MKKYIELMKELGFIDTTDKQSGELVKQFTKYDDKGLITDTINYFYTRETGVTVYTNSVKHLAGSRLDGDLLFAVQSIFYELQEEMEKKALWAKNDKEYSFPKTLEYTMEELMDDYIADQKHKYGE